MQVQAQNKSWLKRDTQACLIPLLVQSWCRNEQRTDHLRIKVCFALAIHIQSCPVQHGVNVLSVPFIGVIVQFSLKTQLHVYNKDT